MTDVQAEPAAKPKKAIAKKAAAAEVAMVPDTPPPAAEAPAPAPKTGRAFPPFGELTVLVYGDQGTGKTSFFCKSGAAMIFATEPGAEFQTAPVRRIDRFSPTTATGEPGSSFVERVDSIVAAAQSGALKKSGITLVAVDTVDRLQQMAVEHICVANGVMTVGDIPYGKGFTLVFQALVNQIRRLQAVVNVGFTSHALTASEEVEGANGIKKEIEKRKPSADRRIAEWLAGELNLVGYAYKSAEGKFLIKFHSDARLETKDRTGLLETLHRPFPTDWATIRSAYDAQAAAAGIELRSKWA